MRNIAQYPVTREEVRLSLQEAMEKYEGQTGSIQPMILQDLLLKVDDDRWFDSTFDSFYTRKKER